MPDTTQEPPEVSDDILRLVSSPGLFRVTRQFIDSMVGRLVADGLQDLSDTDLEHSLGPCIAGPQLVTVAKRLRDMGVLQRLVNHLRAEDRPIRQFNERLVHIRHSAHQYLDELRITLLEDPAVYASYGGRAAAVINEYVDTLIQRVRNERRYSNPRYDRQGELAASLICLAMEYPQTYADLVEHAVGTDGIRVLSGVSGLESVLGGLSDDHDYVLIQESGGPYRLYHESQKPTGSGFIPLTCARDVCEVISRLLMQASVVVEAAGESPAR